MKTGLRWTRCLLLGLLVASCVWAQSSTDQNSTVEQKTKHAKKTEPSPGRQIGNGAGNVAGGAGKGAGDLAKGTGKGVVDLVTLHPIDAGTAVGKGAVGAGKDVTVGTAKGTGKMVKGIGRAFKKIL